MPTGAISLGKRQRKTTESLSTDSGISGLPKSAGPSKRAARGGPSKSEYGSSNTNNAQINEISQDDSSSSMLDDDVDEIDEFGNKRDKR